MKTKYFIFLFIIQIVLIFPQTKLSGVIQKDSTLRSSDSPFKLSGTLFVGNGAKLTIGSGIEIDMNGHTIDFKYNGIGTIDAEGATFNGYSGALVFREGINGFIKNCSFDKVYISIEKAEVEIEGNNFSNLRYPVMISEGANPKLSGNSFTNVEFPYIALSAYFCTIDWNIPYNEIGYILDSKLVTSGNANVSIVKETIIRLKNTFISIEGKSFTAEEVTFEGSGTNRIKFENGNSTLKKCSIEGTYVEMNGGEIIIENVDFNNAKYSLIMNNNNDPKPQLSGLTYNNIEVEDIYLNCAVNSDFTIQDLGIDYLLGSCYIQEGGNLNIDSGVRIKFKSGGINQSGGVLTADGVEFIGLNKSYVSIINGRLENCLFDAVDIKIEGGNPVIKGNEFQNTETPIILNIAAHPDLSGNINIDDIIIRGNVTENQTIKKLEYDYSMKKTNQFNISVSNNAELFIEPGVKIIEPYIKLGSSDDPGNIKADSVHIVSGVITHSEGGGYIKNSKLEDVHFYFYKGKSVYSGNYITGIFETKTITDTVSAENNFWGHSSGPKNLGNPGGQGTFVKNNVDFIPFLQTNPIDNNSRPNAKFTVHPDSGGIKTIFAFDASESFDNEDSTNLMVRWDFDEDGNYDTDWQKKLTATHQFDSTDFYSVKLDVKDSEGQTGVVYNKVVVKEAVAKNTPPVADFTFTPESGAIGTEISLDASASSDKEDKISSLKFSWKFGGENWNVLNSTSPITNYTFASGGNFDISLKVEDSDGLATTITKNITIGELTISKFRINQESATDSLYGDFIIRNNSSQAVKDIKCRAYLGSQSDLFELEPSGIISEILPGRGVKIKAKIFVNHIVDKKELRCEIFEIDGTETEIFSKDTLSVYYVRNKNSGKNQRAYDLNKDAYTFDNTGLSFYGLTNWLRAFSNLSTFDAIGTILGGLLGRYEGLCHGYAATSNRYFVNDSEKPVSMETGEMTLNYKVVEDNIIRYFMRQNYEPQKEYATDILEAVNEIKTQFTSDIPVMILLSGHTISAYKLLIWHNQKQADLYVYDSNYPSTVSVCELSWEGTHSFKYESFKKFYWQLAPEWPSDEELSDGITGLYKEEIKSLNKDDLTFIGTACPVRVWITDKFGRISGYPDNINNQINNIADSEIKRIYNAEKDSVTLLYVPKNLDYKFQVAALDTGKMNLDILIPVSDTSTIASSFSDINISTPYWNAFINIDDSLKSSLNIDSDGDGEIDNIITSVGEIIDYNSSEKEITDFILEQNYPNPFNPSTRIKFFIPEEGRYKIEVYNILGQKITELLNKDLIPGQYTLQFKAGDMASGIYFYKLAGDNVNLTKKMMLIK